jgi:hypothetical protein
LVDRTSITHALAARSDALLHAALQPCASDICPEMRPASSMCPALAFGPVSSWYSIVRLRRCSGGTRQPEEIA